MWNLFQFLTSGLLAVVVPNASQVEYRSCSYAGVFHVRVNASFSLTSQQADELCQSLFSSLATEEQIREAYSKGLDTCRYGWINDQRILMLQHEVRADCPSNETGVIFLEDTPEFLSDAYCYDASVTSYLDCDETVISASVTPPDTETEEAIVVTSSPGPSDNVTEKATTEDSEGEELEGDGLKTENPTVQTDTQITPDAIEPIPEVQNSTEAPEGSGRGTTKSSGMASADGDHIIEDMELPTQPATVPVTLTKQGEEETEEETTEANPSVDNEALNATAATTSPDETTANSGPESTANSGLALPEGEDTDDSVQQMNGTEAVDVSNTVVPVGTLEPSGVNHSEGDEDEHLAFSTISPVGGTTTITVTFTTSESEDIYDEDNPDKKENSTTVPSLDDVPETTHTPADQDVDLQEEVPNGDNISHAASPGHPAPRGRMGPKVTELDAVPTPEAHNESGAPAWLIIFSFVMAVGVLICVFAAVATKEKWYGPRRQTSAISTDNRDDSEKRAAVSLSVDKQQEMVTLMNKSQVQTNGRTDEFTVIALGEPPEKEFLA